MSVRVDASDVLEHLERIESVIAGTGQRAVARRAVSLMNREIRQAFARKRDPVSGRGWVPRKYRAPGSLMHQTGALAGSVDADVDVDKNGRIKIKAVVSRDHAKAGALFFGRGYKSRSRSRKTSIMLPRRYAGFGRATKKELTAYAERLLK